MRWAPAMIVSMAALTAQPGVAPTSPGSSVPPGGLLTPEAVFDGLEEAWRRRSLDGYLALWRFGSAEALRREAAFPANHFSAGATEIVVDRPASIDRDLPGFKVSAQVSSVTEPRGRFEQWLFAVERDASGWRVVAREPAGQIEGLVHLSLDPAGFRADGLTLQLEDFNLRMDRGTLFTSPPDVGPTAMVFVGEGRVRVAPDPPTEKHQLRLFCGRPELEEAVRWAYVRLHPADLQQVLRPARLEADANASRRLAVARRLWDEHAGRSFVLDAQLPGSPWWVMPGPGDAAVTFEAGGRGALTFYVNQGQPESISLFDRAERRQVCLYPAAGRPLRYDEDDGREADVVHHDLQASFEPATGRIQAVDTLTIRLLCPAFTLRLRLDDGLEVDSVSSAEVGRHLFFRVRHQDSLLVSLGPWSGRTGEMKLTVRYRGILETDELDREAIQIFPEPPQPGQADEFRLEPTRIYTNRRPWYPQREIDDYTTARLRLELPEGLTALSGGSRRVLSSPGSGRHVVEYDQALPGKYLTVALGRLEETATTTGAAVPVLGFALPRTGGICRELLEHAADILGYFSGEFGPFPYASLTLAVVEGRTPGGFSPPGMTIIQHRPLFVQGTLRSDPADFSRVPGFFVAHELAHQWWGHGVAGQSYHDRWLSEAMAQYAAALWARRAHGEDTFRGILGRLAYWAWRAGSNGPISLGNRLGHLEDDPKVYRAIVYDKGAYVLHMLRGIVGETAFRKGLTDLQVRSRFQKIGTEDLQAALEQASGQSLGPYFRAWIYTTELPKLFWSSTTTPTASGYITQVRVRAAGLPAPVPLEVAVVHAGGREVRRVRLDPEGGVFEIQTPGAPRGVEINRDLGLLAEVVKD